MKLLICVKCAHESMAPMKSVSPRPEKATCALCGRRRFCLTYEVKLKRDDPTWQNR